MPEIVIYSVGSMLLADIEESLFRAGVAIRAGIQNQESPNRLPGSIPLYRPDALPEGLTDLPFLVPCFTPGDRQSVAHEAARAGFSSPFSLIDPSVIVPRSLEWAAGLFVNTGCTLGAASCFDIFVAINRGASVGHHARLGAFVSIGPGAVLAGNVRVGKGAFIGAGAVVLPEITIGENAVVGAGAVVTRDVPGRCMVLGNPARIVKRDIPGYKDRTVT